MDLYAEHILDHYRHPRCHGTMVDPSVTHTERNMSCGDALTVTLKIEDDHITDILWSGTGCAISQAGMSILSEILKDTSIPDALAISPEKIRTMLGVPIGPRRLKCALLCLHTLKNTLRTFQGQEPQTWMETVEMA